jgi:hypothetical protein
MKLESGREVGELKGLTMAQRIKCKDNMTYTKTAEGMAIGNLFQTNCLYAMYGLGFDDLEKLKGYSDNEITEMSFKVQEAEEKAANPTSKD